MKKINEIRFILLYGKKPTDKELAQFILFGAKYENN